MKNKANGSLKVQKTFNFPRAKSTKMLWSGVSFTFNSIFIWVGQHFMWISVLENHSRLLLFPISLLIFYFKYLISRNVLISLSSSLNSIYSILDSSHILEFLAEMWGSHFLDLSDFIFFKAKVGRWQIWWRWKQAIGCTTISHWVRSWLHWCWT